MLIFKIGTIYDLISLKMNPFKSVLLYFIVDRGLATQTKNYASCFKRDHPFWSLSHVVFVLVFFSLSLSRCVFARELCTWFKLDFL